MKSSILNVMQSRRRICQWALSIGLLACSQASLRAITLYPAAWPAFVTAVATPDATVIVQSPLVAGSTAFVAKGVKILGGDGGGITVGAFTALEIRGSDVSISGLTFTNGTGTAVFINHAFSATSGNNFSFVGNTLRSVGNGVIDVATVLRTSMEISRNRFQSISGSAISLSGKLSQVQINDNSFTNSLGTATAIACTAVNSLTMDGNTIDGPWQNSIFLSTCTGAIVKGNILRNATLLMSRGIYLGSCSQCQIQANTVAGATFQGIFVGGGGAATEMVINGNIVTKVVGLNPVGIQLEGLDGVLVTNNRVSNIGIVAGSAGIGALQCQNVTVTGNVTRATGQRGLYFLHCQFIDVRTNRIQNNSPAVPAMLSAIEVAGVGHKHDIRDNIFMTLGLAAPVLPYLNPSLSGIIIDDTGPMIGTPSFAGSNRSI
jgi:Right handed beta helix region